MFDFEKIAKDIKKMICCPICKRKCAKDQIKLKGFFDNTFFFETNCSNNHLPAHMVIVATKNNGTGKGKCVSTNEIAKFHKQITNFKGNFKTIFHNNGSNNGKN